MVHVKGGLCAPHKGPCTAIVWHAWSQGTLLAALCGCFPPNIAPTPPRPPAHAPVTMPMALQMATSSTQESHQHSLKLGSQCLKVCSIISNRMLWSRAGGA